jgi:uncharacterized protein YbjQ (UPF0145 family)
VIVTSGGDVNGRVVAEILGIVRGIVVQVPTRHQRIQGAMEAKLEGGNIRLFVEVCEAARSGAYAAMVEHAESIGADAIVGARYQSAPFASSEGTMEVMAYGTAVRLV